MSSATIAIARSNTLPDLIRLLTDLAVPDQIYIAHRLQRAYRKKVDDIKRGAEGIFTVVTPSNQYRSRAVILALGRNGSPKKLGVKGEKQ